MQRYKCNSGFPDPTGSYVRYAEAQEIISTLTAKHAALVAEVKARRAERQTFFSQTPCDEWTKIVYAVHDAAAHTDAIGTMEG